jgi:hypothetical protein
MSATRVLEVVIALTFMFYVAALLSSGLVEWLANLMKKRAKYLLRGLKSMLEGNKQPGELGVLSKLLTGNAQASTEQTLYKAAVKTAVREDGVVTAAETDDILEQVVRHPLVMAFAQATPDGTITRLPSYLPARTFVDALFDVLQEKSTTGNKDVNTLKDGITKLADGQLKQALTALLRSHGNDLEKLGKAVEHWYDDRMDRISGAYKRWARRWLIVIGIVIATGMHLDALGLARDLWTDEPARAAIIKQTENAVACQDKPEDEQGECIDTTVAALAAQGPPIGPQAWKDFPDEGWDIVLLFLGIALTGAASTLGAPFWFDALGRLNSLRNSGPKPPKTED